MPNQLENILSKIVKYGLYAILLTPLAFWPRALYGFMTPKFILFQMLVEIVFAAWVALKVLHNPNKTQNPNNPNSEYLGKFVNSDYGKWLVRALFGFFGVSLLSAIFGIDFSRSFWGIGARMTGLFAELHFLAWLLVLVSYFKNDTEKWYRYMNFSFAV
ncbi:MAG: hypothetical protein AAB958_01645, partial [Patescibacteria group bacterium]